MGLVAVIWVLGRWRFVVIVERNPHLVPSFEPTIHMNLQHPHVTTSTISNGHDTI